jgi:hypothetical protein
MTTPLKILRTTNNSVVNIIGDPVVAVAPSGFSTIDIITSVNPATMYVLVYDPNAAGEKIKRVSVADFIASLEIITL